MILTGGEGHKEEPPENKQRDEILYVCIPYVSIHHVRC